MPRTLGWPTVHERIHGSWAARSATSHCVASRSARAASSKRGELPGESRACQGSRRRGSGLSTRRRTAPPHRVRAHSTASRSIRATSTSLMASSIQPMPTEPSSGESGDSPCTHNGPRLEPNAELSPRASWGAHSDSDVPHAFHMRTTRLRAITLGTRCLTAKLGGPVFD